MFESDKKDLIFSLVSIFLGCMTATILISYFGFWAIILFISKFIGALIVIPVVAIISCCLMWFVIGKIVKYIKMRNATSFTIVK